MEISLSSEHQEHSSIPKRKRQPTFYQQYVGYQLERIVEPWAVKYVALAMAGQIDAAISLSIAARNEKCGVIVAKFWQARVPVFRRSVNYFKRYGNTIIAK